MERIIFPQGIPKEQESLHAYLQKGGYQALRKALHTLSPQDLVNEITKSGLCGRGGAGFPTGKKWAITKQTQAQPKYVVCNGGEDEPGSIKDRLLMETRPHLVLEGVLLASICVGARQAYLYINTNYQTVIRKMEQAIAEAERAGYLGEKILGSDVSLDVVIIKAPTNYVAGEDTAVLEVIEGKAPLPRPKPPYPATQGLFGQPTLVNNVETFANVPLILARGAEWFRSIGTDESPGTMIFCLGEEVNKPGAYELPFGTPLRYLIYDCGGGLKGNKKLKAVQPGGPSTALLAPDRIDIPLDHKSLVEAGSALGCGIVHLIPEDACMVEETIHIAKFFARECCGQCPACRMETGTLVALLEKVRQGQGGGAIFDQFAKVIDFNRGKGYCSLINMPGPPIQSALKLFRPDFEHHLQYGTCPSASNV